MAQKTRSHAAESAEQKDLGINKRVCSKCLRILHATSDNFWSNNSSPDGRMSICIGCKKGITEIPSNVNRCRSCLVVKDLSSFEGNRSTCKKCRSARCYQLADKDQAKARHKKWREKNKEKHNSSGRKWKKENIEKHRAYNKAWAKSNPDKVKEKDHKRRAAKIKAIPKWFDKDKCAEVYRACEELNSKGVERYEVDHIVPLQGSNVCGFHVHYNLRVVTMSENRSKGNKLIEVNDK